MRRRLGVQVARPLRNPAVAPIENCPREPHDRDPEQQHHRAPDQLDALAVIACEAAHGAGVQLECRMLRHRLKPGVHAGLPSRHMHLIIGIGEGLDGMIDVVRTPNARRGGPGPRR